MKTNYLLLRSILCIAFFSLTISASGADFYWKSNAVDNIFTNPANWTDVTGTFTPTGSDGQLRPWSGDNVFFNQSVNTFTTINCTGGKCLNVNLPNAGSAVYTFNNELNVFGSINSPVSRLRLGSGSKIVFDGSGAKTIQFTNALAANNNYITFEFRGNGSYSLVNNLISFGTSGSFTLHDNVQVSTAGYDLSLNFIKFIAPAVSASMNLNNSNVKLYEGIFYGEYNGTLPPGPGVSVSAANTTLELCIIYNNSGAQSITGVERILFRPGVSYPVLSSENMTLQSDTVYVDANTFSAYSDLSCDYFELLKPTSIYGAVSGAIRFNDFIVPPACTGTSSLNFATPVSTYTFQNTSGVSKTIEMLFKNVNFTGSNVNSNSTNDQGGNTGNISWTTPPVGLSFYWVGGAGDWNDPTQWSIISSGGAPQLATGCIPTLLDDVYFDANSFTAVGQNVTNVDLTPLFSKNVYWTDPANEAGILNGFYESYNWYIAGDVNLTGLNTTVGAKAILHMIGSGVHDFWPPNMTYPREMYFEGSGSYTLRDNLSMLGFSPYTGLAHTNGIFNTNGFTIDANSFSSYPLAPGISRELFMDGSTFELNNFFVASGLMTDFSAVNSEVNLNSPTSELTIYDGYSAFTAPSTLANMILPKVSFTSAVGTPRILYGSNIISITEMNVTPNLQQYYGGIRIGTLNLTGGTTLSLQNIRITDAVNVSGAACSDLVTIKSNTSGVQGSLFKPTGTFTIDRAYVQDVTAAAGVPLTVTNGVDGGNNTNITIGAGTPRNFYWVDNSGNWNDGSHWSIGLSGGDPAITNPSGCIPTAIDNVFFNTLSFDVAGETVTITSDANCKNMDWTGSGVWSPTLAGNNTTLQLNIYGSITLVNNLSWTFNGYTNMRGSNLAVNSQTLDFQGVNMGGRLRFNGGGRYDFINDVSIYNPGFNTFGWQDGSFILSTGKVYCNGYNLSATSILLYLSTASNYFDATNSMINTERLWNQHGGNATNYSFANSQVTTSIPTSSIVIEATVPTNYHNFTLAGVQLNASNTVNAQRVTQTNLVTNSTGNWNMDTLILAQSSSNTFQAGRTYTVNDTLIAFGTPCIPVILKADGGTATYESTSQNTFIQFGSLQNMTASLAPSGASSAGYQVIGADVGGNTNWDFSPAASLPYLGAYNVSANCDALPFGVTTAGFSPVPGTTYAWNTGSTASTLDLDSSGIYTVTVSYSVSCSVIDSIEFTIANTLDVQSASVVMPGCFEDSTGTISTTVLGGNNNFDYTWTSPTGNTFTINPTDSTQLSDLAAGNYQIIVNQTNNSVCADTLSITITEPTLLAPDLIVTNLACNGDTDGEIVATGTGGTPGYQVSMDGGLFNPAPFNFTGLPVGSYEIVVQDLNGCLDTLTQAISQPTLLAASGNTVSPLCNGDSNGSIGLTINGGTPSYQVSVNGAGFTPSASSYGGLAAGNYQLIVEDQNGCRDTINQVISEPAVLLASTAVTSNYNGSDVSCNGMTDGSISSSATGGTVNYNYIWNTSPIQTTQNLTGVGAGSYTVTITDQNGCTSQSSVTISEPAILSDTYVVDQDANCNVADGAATITTLGGTPVYTFTWSNNPGNTTNSATDLVAGITNVTITDLNGCVDNLAITINSINAPVPYLSADSVLCLGGSTGIAIVDSVSGNGGYTFIWSDNLGNPLGQTNDTATGLPAGIYSVQVTDLNGCSAVQTVTVDEPVSSVTIAVVNVTSPACNTSDEGSITVSASGGTGTIDYSWNTTPAQTTPSITNLPEGTYIVTATDANGCSIDEVVQITAPTALALTAVQNDVSCFNGADGEISVTAQGGTPTYTYSWTGSSSTTNQATTLGVGSYTALVSDANGCQDSLSFVVTEPTVLVAEILSSSSPDCGISNGTITLDVNGGTPNYSFLWNDGSTNQDNTMAAAGVNSVVITDQNGCTQSLDIDLSCTLFEIPELLTPNNDGKNDLWAITGLENFPNTEVEIFNRWGTKVFGSDDYKNNWDGTSQSNLNIAGDQLPESSYFYVLTLGGPENDPNAGKVFKGYIYIKRN